MTEMWANFVVVSFSLIVVFPPFAPTVSNEYVEKIVSHKMESIKEKPGEKNTHTFSKSNKR